MPVPDSTTAAPPGTTAPPSGSTAAPTKPAAALQAAQLSALNPQGLKISIPGETTDLC